jgi:hypothetical protein
MDRRVGSIQVSAGSGAESTDHSLFAASRRATAITNPLVFPRSLRSVLRLDDPTGFKRSRSLGVDVGLTARRHAYGEVDWSGRISSCDDAMLGMLFEAAGILLTRVPKWSGLKAWG